MIRTAIYITKASFVWRGYLREIRNAIARKGEIGLYDNLKPKNLKSRFY